MKKAAITPDDLHWVRFAEGGFTREQAAHACGITVRQWRRWERGEARIAPAAFRLIAILAAGRLDEIHEAWAGWRLVRDTGELVNPGGVAFTAGEIAALPLLYSIIAELERQLRGRSHEISGYDLSNVTPFRR